MNAATEMLPRSAREARSDLFNRQSHWSEARAWHTNVALSLIGFGLFLLARQFISEFDSFRFGFDGVSGFSALLYLTACWIVLTKPVDRFTLHLIISVAIACRLVTLYSDPFLSSDVYRYVWDGVVQHAGINPYRYVPGSPALAFLREPNLDIYSNINRRDYAHTIYPPVAQFVFYLTTLISPTLTCMKTAMVLFEGLTAWALIKLLVHLGYRREQVLLYAWCPLLVWEFGGSGHLDAVAMAFITLALLFRFRDRPVLTGLFLGLAVATKMYPLVLFPALYRRGDWKMPATLTAVIAFGYACYLSVGWAVFGFLTGYADEEGLKTGARYFLLELSQRIPGFTHLPTIVFYIFSAAVFGSTMLWAWKTCCKADVVHSYRLSSSGIRPFLLTKADFLQGQGNFLPPAFAFAAILMFLFAPHYAWYIAWLLPFFCLMPSLPMATYLMAFFYGYTTWLADPGPKMFLLNERLYGATLLAFGIHLTFKAWMPYRANFLAHRQTAETASNPKNVSSNFDYQSYPEPSL